MTSAWAGALHGFEGEIVEPGEPGYDEMRKVFNAMVDRRPSVIARCRTEADVVCAIQAAKASAGPLAVRGGGHSVAGHGVCDGGMVLDLSLMRRVTLDTSAAEVVAEGGALWSDVDRASSRFCLAVPGGIVSSTGIGGFTLGGGLGWLSRSKGLACDNLIGARIVTAAGEVLDVSEDREPELFWAIRGGGGNFGVVTQFRFQAHKVDRVNVLICVYSQDSAAQVVKGFCEVMDSAGDEVAAMLDFSSAGEGLAMSSAPRRKHVVTLLGFCAKPGADGVEALAPLTRLAQPLARLQKQMRYRSWQCLLDQTAPAGRYNYWKSEFLSNMTDSSYEAIVGVGEAPVSPESHVHLIRGGGFAGRVPLEATAFTARTAPYIAHLISTWLDPRESQACIERTRMSHRRLEPFACGPAYLNFVGEEDTGRVEQSYGTETHARLRRVKSQFDPDNVFSLNHNIKPLER